MKNIKQLIAILCVWQLAQSQKDYAAEDYLKSCKWDGDCSSSQPFCTILHSDDTDPKNIQIYGVCVQCRDECDCSVNQQCGTDQKLPATAMAFSVKGESAADSSQSQLRLLAMSGLSIPSKCQEYGHSKQELMNMGLGPNGDSALGKGCRTTSENDMHTQLNKMSNVCSPRVQYGWNLSEFKTTDSQPMFCGALSQNAQFLGREKGNPDDEMDKTDENIRLNGPTPGGQFSVEQPIQSQNRMGCAPRFSFDKKNSTCDMLDSDSDKSCDMMNKVGVCIPQIDSVKDMGAYPKKLTIPDSSKQNQIGGSPDFVGCSENGVRLAQNGKIAISDNKQLALSLTSVLATPQDWMGQCSGNDFKGRNTCKICQEGKTRCTQQRGQSQICYRGKQQAQKGFSALGAAQTKVDGTIVRGSLINEYTVCIVTCFTLQFVWAIISSCCIGPLISKKKGNENLLNKM